MNYLKHMTSLLLALLLFSIASVNAAESITYIHTDHLGSPIAATNEDGSVKWTEDYQPFGIQRTNQDSDNTTGFTGHQHDDALDLTYMQARWYHPEVGRFMALDPIVFRTSDLSSFGRYTYAANNPYYYVDPDGRANDRQIDLQNVRNFQGQQGVDTYNATFTTVNPEAAKSLAPGMGVVDGIENFNNGEYLIGIAMIASEIPVLKGLKALKATKSLKKQASELVPLNDGKHRVKLRSEKQQLEIDLAGKDHAGIPTPHTKVSKRNNKAPEHSQPAYNTSNASATTRASTQEDIRTARRYLEKQDR